MKKRCTRFKPRRWPILALQKLTTHRALRKGFPEVIYGAGKTADQIFKIAAHLQEHEQRFLITRVSPEQARMVKKAIQKAVYHPMARCMTVEKTPLPKHPGTIAVLCAGTSDLPVAEEAAVTADIMGNKVETDSRYRRGRLASHARPPGDASKRQCVDRRRRHGRRASERGGRLVSKPVIAVPTSVGYGASFGGIAALLGMLNSCGSGVTVVNIDNGFGAGYAASQINALAAQAYWQARMIPNLVNKFATAFEFSHENTLL